MLPGEERPLAFTWPVWAGDEGKPRAFRFLDAAKAPIDLTGKIVEMHVFFELGGQQVRQVLSSVGPEARIEFAIQTGEDKGMFFVTLDGDWTKTLPRSPVVVTYEMVLVGAVSRQTRLVGVLDVQGRQAGG